MSSHAKSSPSGAHGWMRCAGWIPSPGSSAAADEGSDAHALAEMCLLEGTDASRYIGMEMPNGTVVGADMASFVQQYLDYVRGVATANGGTLLVEQKLPIDHLTGEEGATGTSDAVIVLDDEITIVDLKYGRGVPVEAEDNEQLMIYGHAALTQFDLLGGIERVRMVVHQPRLGSVSEWVLSTEELQERCKSVRPAVLNRQNPDVVASPGEKQCRWCGNKATCPALRAEVANVIGTGKVATPDDFLDPVSEPGQDSDADWLAAALAKADLIESWLKAVRAEVERRLLAGESVPGFKLVQGRKGPRQWSDLAAAEELLKGMRLKTEEMYDFTLISPTTAEKLAPKFDKNGKAIPPKDGEPKPVIGPRQWPKVKELIVQSEGKPSVAPESDKRPALVRTDVAACFDEEPESDLV